MVAPDIFLIVGLLLDIGGAICLATPELLRLFGWTTFGRLMIARDRLESGGLNPNDTGFKELIDIHNKNFRSVEITTADVNYIRYGPGFTPAVEADETVGITLPNWPSEAEDSFTVENRVWYDYAEEFPEDTDFEVGGVGMLPELVYPEITRRLDRREGQYRVAGLFLIVVGFVLQLIVALI